MMRKQPFFTILLAMLMSMTGAKMFSQEVQTKRIIKNLTAGTLSEFISEVEKYQIEELTVSGELNGDDIFLIRAMAGIIMDHMETEFCPIYSGATKGKLRVLDLSDAYIVEGGRDYYRMMISSSEDAWGYEKYTVSNTISDCMFANCTKLEELTLPRSVTSISNPLADIQAYKPLPMNLKKLKVADGNQYYISPGDCNAIIEKSTMTLIAGCQTTVIPNDVRSIGNFAFRDFRGLTSITIPDGVTSIGNHAFRECSGLTSITISNSVTSIGISAFYGCSSLTSVTIPKNVTSIDDFVFYDCDNLQSLAVEATTPPTISENTFPNRSNMPLHVPSGSVESYANAEYWKEFRGIGAIGSVIKGDRFTAETTGGVILSYYVTNISPMEVEVWNVSDKSTVSNVVIPGSVIGPDGQQYAVTGIRSKTFENCNSLTSITIPNSVSTIGSSAFNQTPWYNNQPDGLVYAGKVAYKYKGTMPANTSITIKNGTLGITSEAFSGCSGLISITIPNSVTNIGGSAFYRCSSLTSITIPNSVTNIGGSAFYGCSGLTSITIPNSVTNIGGSAFYNCSGLTSITIPNSVTSIGGSAFEDCSSLTSITIPNSVTSIGNGAFSGCSGLTSIAIPNSVTSIGNSAFSGCSGLTSITIPNSVTSIGNSAFMYCSGLTSITVPNSVTSIGYSAFSVCSGLISFTIPNKVTTIADQTFYGCSSLTSITIPNSVTSIGGSAFENCSSLTSITIPNSVTTIRYQAFRNCSSLTSVIVDIEEPLNLGSWYTYFSNRDKIPLYVPKGCKNAYKTANYWKGFKEIKEFAKDEEMTYAIEDDNSVIAKVVNDHTNKDVVVSESVIIDGEAYLVKAIAEQAFKNNTDMTLICIPKTIEEIGDDAFAGCSGLKAIYSYAEEPIALGSANAMVRTRADGDEAHASDVFAQVNKETCILYVPKNSGDKYRSAAGWSEFQNIIEMQSATLGDANNDATVDIQDAAAAAGYIMEGKTENFIFKNADVKTDNKIDAADIVKIVNLMK